MDIFLEIWEFIISIWGFLGIGVITLFTFIIKFYFKSDLKFYKIIESFPLISEDRVKKGVIEIESKFLRNLSITNDFSNFTLKERRGKLDDLLSSLDNLDTSKIRYNRKKIDTFVNKIKEILTSQQAELTLDFIFNDKGEMVESSSTSKSIDWTAFKYTNVHDVIKKSDINKPYLFKLLDF